MSIEVARTAMNHCQSERCGACWKCKEDQEVARLLATVDWPRTAFFDTHPCTLVSYHAPRPVITEYHHSKPVYLQNRLYGRIVHGPDMWVCSNCHEAIHAWVYWLMGERRKPAHIGNAAKAEAERVLAWYTAELPAA